MDEPRWLDEQENRAWRGYRRMRRLLDLELARELMQDAGLSEPDYDVLSDLSETPEQRLRLSELADRMLWSRSRLSHHISRMQQRGLVSREECATDGRGSVVVLTPAGRRAAYLGVIRRRQGCGHRRRRRGYRPRTGGWTRKA